MTGRDLSGEEPGALTRRRARQHYLGLVRKFKFEAASLILALILGKPMKESLRQDLGVSQGSFAIFVTRPISLILLLATTASLAATAIRRAWR